MMGAIMDGYERRINESAAASSPDAFRIAEEQHRAMEDAKQAFPLWCAMSQANLDFVVAALNDGADSNQEIGPRRITPAQYAAVLVETAAVGLIDTITDRERTDQDCDDAVDFFAYCTDLLNVLARYGANSDSPSAGGWTPREKVAAVVAEYFPVIEKVMDGGYVQTGETLR